MSKGVAIAVSSKKNYTINLATLQWNPSIRTSPLIGTPCAVPAIHREVYEEREVLL